MLSYLYYLLRSIIQYIAYKFIFTPKKIITKLYPDTISNIKIKSKNQKMIDVILCYPNELKSIGDKIIIFSHGNTAINMSQYEFLLRLSVQLNIPVVGYDYQGYGTSEGSCSEQNCYDDHECVVEYVKSNYPNTKIYLTGRSLGTGIVVDYISKYKWIDPVILISPYESILHTITNDNSIFRKLFESYDMFNTISKIKNVTCPIKIIHGKDDTLVNIMHAQNLYNMISNKTFTPIWIESCGHKDILSKLPFEELKEITNT